MLYQIGVYLPISDGTLVSNLKDPLKRDIFNGLFLQLIFENSSPTTALIFILRNSLSWFSDKILKSITLLVAFIIY